MLAKIFDLIPFEVHQLVFSHCHQAISSTVHHGRAGKKQSLLTTKLSSEIITLGNHNWPDIEVDNNHYL
jgi:hypothetical protein